MLNLMSSSFTSDTEFWPSTTYLGMKLHPRNCQTAPVMCNKWCGGFTVGLTRRTQQWNSSHVNPSQSLRNPEWTGSLPVPLWPGCHTGWEGAGLWPRATVQYLAPQGDAESGGESSLVYGETQHQGCQAVLWPPRATLYWVTFLTVYCPVTWLCALRSIWPAYSPSVL